MMKSIQRKGIPLFLSAFLMISFAGVKSATAQFGNTGEILLSGTQDANLLLEEYLKPFGNGFGADLNSGWINSGRPYRTLGFDLRISAALSIVPTGDRTFFVDDLNFQNLERVGGPDESQTAFGSDASGSVMGVFGTNPFTGLRQEITRFTMPQGSGYPYVPAPMVQLTVGAIKDTDVSIRYAPTVTVDEFSMNLFGFGVRHGLNQWLPGGGVLPVDISVQAGYTKLNSNFGLDLQPETGNDIYNPFSGTPELWSGQRIDMEASGFTGNLIVGKNLPIISVFGGVGFQTSTVSFASPGSYPITSFNPDYDPTSTAEDTRQRRIERLDDPISLEFSGENSVHALAGFRLRLGFIAVSASYTLSRYPVLNAGVGLSFR
jgi:hypothetical protein